MVDESRILCFEYKCSIVDVDRSNLLDVIIEYEDKAREIGVETTRNPEFYYMWRMKHYPITKDIVLLTMFERLPDLIYIWVGEQRDAAPPCIDGGHIRKTEKLLVWRNAEEKEKVFAFEPQVMQCEDIMHDNMDRVEEHFKSFDIELVANAFVAEGENEKDINLNNANHIEVNNANHIDLEETWADLILEYGCPPDDPRAFNKYMNHIKKSKKATLKQFKNGRKDNGGNTKENADTPATPVNKSGTIQSEDDEVGDNDYANVDFENNSDSDIDFVFEPQDFIPSDEKGDEDINVPLIEDTWEPDKWYDFVDDVNDDTYLARLYKNGELYEEKPFGKIELNEWMIFTEKSHFKDTLKDYCVQEQFALMVLCADNVRYTATCAAECCSWRVHASRLVDGRTWAIKKIWPNFHTCRGLQTHNPIANVKWASAKLMNYIRQNPDCKGNDLNDHLYNMYGLYMKKSSLYNVKAYVINTIFGGHDKSYALLPRYLKMIHQTNPGSVAFYTTTEIGYPKKSLQFSTIFISFIAQLKGFIRGCRSLIGVDGTHLKGNYGGILLSAIALDGNNEIFPLAYAVVCIENEDNWSFFFWNLYNHLKEAGRDDWTIISDRQKGVDLALKKVWPTAKRRFCCRHLSRNFKKSFPGPLMYILFWRACNASNPYSFKKAMERLRKEGKTPVMKWFAQPGSQFKWTKHKFDPKLCCDTNTSNFVESFNFTLGIDRNQKGMHGKNCF